MSSEFDHTPHPISILIVDDHPVVRLGMVELLSDYPDLQVCGGAADASEAMAKIRSLKPDLLIVDLSLKGTSGLELIKEAHSASPSIGILVSSVHEELLFAERALRAGATGYINKQEPIERILEAIHSVAQGKIFISSRISDLMLRRMVTGKPELDSSPIAKLSDRELEVFEQIGLGLGTAAIAERLHLSIKTIETYRDHIKIKLSLKDASELTRQAVLWVLENS